MATHEFRIIVGDTTDLSFEEADRLYEAGCDDATFGGSNGVVCGTFHREAGDLEQAIRSAVADVRKAGFTVARVESADPVLSRINAELATHPA